MHRSLSLLSLLLLTPAAHASTLFGQVRGIVHDPQHRPLSGAVVTLRAAHSTYTRSVITATDGSFQLPSVPLGEYLVTVMQPNFRTVERPLTLDSDTTAVLHFELPVAGADESVLVRGTSGEADSSSATPTTLVSRQQIADTPGADRTDSLSMITDFVPGAYITHDMLHMRGGHQLSWLLDGVEIPNTNIASNLGAQVDPRDIDYLEVQRGSYTADLGDRTYGIFNVVPRSGFERDREAELVLTAGSFLQTDDQLNFGSHTQRFAYYGSVNGNRTDYGLSTPIPEIRHDAANGFGGLLSLLFNQTGKDQFRFLTQFRDDYFQIPYDPDPDSIENQQFNSSGLRDTQHERDTVVTGSWLHSFNPATVLQVSPFLHLNRADYESNPNDTPVATTSDRSSLYAGGQFSVTNAVSRNTVQVGLYSFGQHDHDLFGAVFNDGSGNPNFLLPAAISGGVVEEFVSDSFKPTTWLTVLGGLRQTTFTGQVTEQATDPRVALALRVPRLDWVFRAFYGRFYQPPPLITVSGPLVQYAQGNNTAFVPLLGERDEEHQFGVQIPLRGWVVDADTFRTRIHNFLDHSNLGESSIYFPVTIDGALVRAWELTLRSPRVGRLGQFHLAYSNQIAEQRGDITGGLICAPAGSPACDAGFAYTPVDHDQRNTLSTGFDTHLPLRLFASAEFSYGSGFTNGEYDPGAPPVDPRYPNQYLPQHTSVDLTLKRSFGEQVTASVTALNVGNDRVLLDNSLTFGGFHYTEPRQIYGEVRYRFHF